MAHVEKQEMRGGGRLKCLDLDTHVVIILSRVWRFIYELYSMEFSVVSWVRNLISDVSCDARYKILGPLLYVYYNILVYSSVCWVE